MTARRPLPRHVLDDSRRRAGVVSRQQLLDAGVSPGVVRRIAQQHRVVLPGVYCLDLTVGAPAGALTFEVRSHAGLLHAGHGSALAGEAAAHHCGLQDPPPSVIEVCVPHDRQLGAVPGYRFRRRRPDVLAPVLPRDLPVMRVEDVVLDLADRGTVDRAVGLVALACQRGLTTPARLAARLAARRRHRWRRMLRGVLDDVATGSTSYLELQYLRHVERGHGLPPSKRQMVVPETGHRSDGAYLDARVLLEHDGSAFHSGPDRDRDLALDAEHLGHDWLTIRSSYRQVLGSPCEVARRVASVRVRRGAAAQIRPCPRCA